MGGDGGCMYILLITFREVAQPIFAFATAEAAEWRCSLRQVVAGVSHAPEPLERRAGAMKERYKSTYLSHEIREVEVVER